MKIQNALLVGHFNNNWDLLARFTECYKLAGAVVSAEEAINLCPLFQPDIIFADAALPGMSGFEMARTIKEQDPSVQIVIFSEQLHLDFLRLAIDLGLDGYISKDMDNEIIEHALRNLQLGKPCFDAAIIQMLLKG